MGKMVIKILFSKLELPSEDRRVSVVYYLHHHMEEEDHGKNISEDDDKGKVQKKKTYTYLPHLSTWPYLPDPTYLTLSTWPPDLPDLPDLPTYLPDLPTWPTWPT